MMTRLGQSGTRSTCVGAVAKGSKSIEPRQEGSFMAVGARQHVVVLVPGFLGFEQAHSRGAWGLGRARPLLLARPKARFDQGASSRVASVLRAALEAHCSLPVPVMALPVTD